MARPFQIVKTLGAMTPLSFHDLAEVLRVRGQFGLSLPRVVAKQGKLRVLPGGMPREVAGVSNGVHPVVSDSEKPGFCLTLCTPVGGPHAAIPHLTRRICLAWWAYAAPRTGEGVHNVRHGPRHLTSRADLKVSRRETLSRCPVPAQKWASTQGSASTGAVPGPPHRRQVPRRPPLSLAART